MLVKLKAIQTQSHYEKVKIKKIKYVYMLMNREHFISPRCTFLAERRASNVVELSSNIHRNTFYHEAW